MGTVYFPETWVSNYQSALRNNPEERGREVHRDGGLKTRNYIEFSGSFFYPQFTLL